MTNIPVSRVCPNDEAWTYCLLGKYEPGSGILWRYSSSPLILNVRQVMPKMMTPKMAVLAFQFFGCAYQPPAGDQTCLG